jgi:hypothetical protein
MTVGTGAARQAKPQEASKMSRFVFRKAVAVGCACSAAAGGGYLLAAQPPAGAQAPGQTSQTSSGADGGAPTPHPCVAAPKRDVGPDPSVNNPKRVAVEQLAADLGVSVDRLAQASEALNQQNVRPGDPRAASILAQQLGLDTAVVQAALTRMLAKPPFNQTGTAAATAKTARVHHARARTAQDGTCTGSIPPADANNPKAVALRNLAQGLGVTEQQLMDAFATAASHGVRDLGDPQMAAQLASALGKDPAHVQQLIDQMTAALRSGQPQAAGARK